MNSEAIIYLLRKTSLTLSEIRSLTPVQFAEILKEVSFQESLDRYHQNHAIASILAAIYNTIPRKRGSKTLHASDFLTWDMPERNKKDSLEEIANKHDVKLPSKEIKNRGE